MRVDFGSFAKNRENTHTRRKILTFPQCGFHTVKVFNVVINEFGWKRDT